MVTLRVRSMVWFATGVVLAVLATALVTQAWRVDAAPGDTDSTFVPTSPCRLFDLRPAPNTVGPRPTPLGSGEVFTQQVTGSNGDCTGPLAIPPDAVAVAMNVTAVNPTAQSNLRVFPADVADVPTVSNLNFSAGQKPVPNKVDVKLSPDGKIKLFNANGSVSVVGDVVGYYTDSSLKELVASVAALEASKPFAAKSEVTADMDLTLVAGPLVSIELTAPVDGQFTISSQATVQHGGPNGSDVICKILESIEDFGSTAPDAPLIQWFEKQDVSDVGTLNGTRVVDIAAGETRSFNLSCRERISDGGLIYYRSLAAIFTPAT